MFPNPEIQPRSTRETPRPTNVAVAEPSIKAATWFQVDGRQIVGENHNSGTINIKGFQGENP